MAWYRLMPREYGMKKIREWKLPNNLLIARLEHEKAADTEIKKMTDPELKQMISKSHAKSENALKLFNQIDHVEKRGSELSAILPEKEHRNETIQTAYARLKKEPLGKCPYEDRYREYLDATIMPGQLALITQLAKETQEDRHESLVGSFSDTMFWEDFRRTHRGRMHYELYHRVNMREFWKRLDFTPEQRAKLNQYEFQAPTINRLTHRISEHTNARNFYRAITEVSKFEMEHGEIPQPMRPGKGRGPTIPATQSQIDGGKVMDQMYEKKLDSLFLKLRGELKKLL